MSSQVEQIKERLGIVEVISAYTKLEKSGSNFKARCPFHNEKTPSFFVSPARNYYYCFGCGVKGDIFTFVQEFEGLDFPGALKLLAERAGVELVKEDPRLRNERQRLYLCLEYATVYFQKQLLENPKYIEALEYLKKRGLTLETIKKWRLGYGGNGGWSDLHLFLKSKKFSDADLLKSGLSKEGQRGGYIDRFRGRITFPLFDNSGRVIGFSGRVFPHSDTVAKYLNSPETELFNKSKILYGLHLAKEAIRKEDKAILVEGQMDLLMSQQAGFANTLGVSGTALTTYHLEQIRRFSNTVVFAFDPDTAGAKAAMRGGQLALALGMDMKIAVLPTGEDPALYILNHQKEWKARLDSAVHLIEFLTLQIANKTEDGQERARLVRSQVLPLLARLASAMEQSHFVKFISDRLGIREDALWQDLSHIEEKPTGLSNDKSNDKDYKNTANGKQKIGEVLVRTDHIEKRLIGLLWLYEDQRITPKENNGALPKEIAQLKETLADVVGPDILKNKLIQYEPVRQDIELEAELYFEDKTQMAQHIDELLHYYRSDQLHERLRKAVEQLHQAEIKGSKEHVQSLMKECQDLSEKISSLPKM